MRMAGPDILLFIVGALLLSGATFAIISQGGTSALTGGGTTAAYSVTFPTKSVDAGKGAVADFTNANVKVPVTQQNVTKLTIAIACADSVPGGTFQYTVKVTAPNGLSVAPKAATCDGSTLKIDVPVASVPPSTAASSTDPSALPRDENATRAVGDWTFAIQGSRGGTLPGLPAGNPTGSVTLTAEVWEPKFELAGK